MSRLADRVLPGDPASGPLQLHHLDADAPIRCVRHRTVTQTRVIATVDGDGTKLVSRGGDEVWTQQLGSAGKASR